MSDLRVGDKILLPVVVTYTHPVVALVAGTAVSVSRYIRPQTDEEARAQAHAVWIANRDDMGLGRDGAAEAVFLRGWMACVAAFRANIEGSIE